jgi:hypothetical protein
MHWEILILPLIAFGVWILSTIFKSTDDDKTKGPARRPEGGRIPRRPAPALDNFLKEARGRRRDMPDDMQSAQRASPAPAPRAAIPPRRPTGPRRPQPVLATIIEDTPLATIIRQPVPVEVVALPVPPPPTAAASGPSPVTVIAPLLTRPKVATSPVLQEVVRLLRSPKTAGAALVLREIFDRRGGRR